MSTASLEPSHREVHARQSSAGLPQPSRVPNRDGFFARLQRRTPAGVAARLLFVGADIVLFNVTFYETLRSVLLRPLGYTSTLAAIAWPALLVVTLTVLFFLRPRPRRAHAAGLILELLVACGICVFAAWAASFQTTGKGVDMSWLRIEVVKTPLWFAMFVRTCPGFTAIIVSGFVLLVWGTLRSPRSRLVRTAPGLVVAAFAVAMVSTFFPIDNDGTKWGLYVGGFTAPLLVFWLLLLCRADVLSFRVFPFVLHTGLVALSYAGFIPVTQTPPEFVCETAAGGAPQPNRFGVTRLFPRGNETPDPSFLFLRKMVLSDEEAFFSYGPTCGLYSIQRQTGALRQMQVRGLIRDLDWSADGRSLWATNWMRGDLTVIDPTSLTAVCSADMFRQGMKTPWRFVVDRDGGHVYMSNVTLPIVAELNVRADGTQCRVSVTRRIDFHATGYTGFTDGAFGLHVDRAHDRLYVLVGMLGGKFEMGLVEIELSSFKVLRDLRLAAGAALVPVRGRDTVLLPSYYADSLYEVALPTMTVVRTIRAAPTITAIEQDDKRGLFYATSRTTGELLVIDDQRGEVVRRYAVGAKPEALALDRTTDQLFVGGGRGIFRIDLARFWSQG